MHAAIDALATGDMSLAVEITDELRASDRAKEEHQQEFGTAIDRRKAALEKKEKLEEREHLQ